MTERQDRGNDLAGRLARLASAPDRRDWADVVSRVPLVAIETGDSPSRRRRALSLAAVGVAIAAIAGVLLTLLIAAPGKRTKPAKPAPVPPFTMIPVTPHDQVPSRVRRVLGLRPGTPVVKLAELPTPEGTYRVWRARNDTSSYGGRYVDTAFLDGQWRGIGGTCAPARGSVLPADPPGTPARIAIPAVEGVPLPAARRRLRRAGLRPGVTYEFPTGRTRLGGGRYFVVAVEDVAPALPGTRINLSVAPERMRGDPKLGRSGFPSNLAPCGTLSFGPQGAEAFGAVASNVSELELVWPGGDRGRIPAQNGAFALTLPLADCRNQTIPTLIVARDARGTELFRVPAADLVRPGLLGSRRITRFDAPRCRPSLVAGDPTFAVLGSAGVPPGTRPKEADLFGMDWPSARLARTAPPVARYGPFEFVVARRTSSVPGACVMVVPRPARAAPATVACGTNAAVASGLVSTSTDGRQRGTPFVLAGLVPDGIVEVRAGGKRSTVEGNVWVLVLSKRPGGLTFVRSDGTASRVPPLAAR